LNDTDSLELIYILSIHLLQAVQWCFYCCLSVCKCNTITTIYS